MTLFARRRVPARSRRASIRDPIAPLGAAMMAAIALFWLVAFVSAFRSHGLAAWSMGVAFIVYDLAHLDVRRRRRRASCSPSRRRRRRRRRPASASASSSPPITRRRRWRRRSTRCSRQTEPARPDPARRRRLRGRHAAVLAARYGLAAPPLGGVARQPRRAERCTGCGCRIAARRARSTPRWRMSTTEVVRHRRRRHAAAPDAIAAMRRAFAAEPALVVGGGVLEPRCRGGASAAGFRSAFQRLRICPQLPRPLRLVASSISCC